MEKANLTKLEIILAHNTTRQGCFQHFNNVSQLTVKCCHSGERPACTLVTAFALRKSNLLTDAII
jgi:hypothetical protein